MTEFDHLIPVRYDDRSLMTGGTVLLRGLFVGLALLAAGCAAPADESVRAAAGPTTTTIDLIEQHRQEDLRRAAEANRAREKELKRCNELRRKASAAWGRWAELKAAGRSTTDVDHEIDRYTDASVALRCPNGFEGQYDDIPELTPEDYGIEDPYQGYEPDPPEEPEPDPGP